MIDFELLKGMFNRWLCKVFGRKPGPSSSSAMVIPIKVLCGRCGDPVSVVRQ